MERIRVWSWAVAGMVFAGAVAQAATPVPMVSQPGYSYTESFGDIAGWGNDFISGTGAERFGGLPTNGLASIPDAEKLTVSSTSWGSGTASGIQKGSGQMVFLTTGSTDNRTSLAVDFFMDFSGVQSGTLSFNWEGIVNSTGNRKSSLRVYWSTDGTSFTELVDAGVLNVENGNPASGSVTTVALPAAFDNQAGAQLRFYCHNGEGGSTGNRPKVGLDDLTVTALPAGGDYPVATITNPSLSAFTVGYSTDGQPFSGTCNTSAVGQLVWTNDLTGESGSVPAAPEWILGNLYLGIGTNVVTVWATNQSGEASSTQVTITRDMREFIKIMAANLTDRNENDQFRYIDTSTRIFKALDPDVVAIQEWLVTNVSRRAYVDAVFGTNFSYSIESYSGANDLPNGIISRWPITDRGEWRDSKVTNRDFAWATINLPGTQDLHVISVHLKANDEAARKKEAAILTNEIYDINWPASDFLVIAGDFNALNRNDDSLLTLSNVVTDVHQPADQAGDDDTNLTRSRPYDYVLPNFLLDDCMVPLTLGGRVFPNGIVFDSRVWVTPPSPAQTNDSAGASDDMQHMAVMKQFALLTCTDCDDDEMTDAWEIDQFGSTTSATSRTDWDGDGFLDAAEYLAGTQPTNSSSGLFMREPALPATGGGYRIQWDSVAGKRYRLRRSTNMMQGFTVIGSVIDASAPVNVVTDFPPESRTLLYGIDLEP